MSSHRTCTRPRWIVAQWSRMLSISIRIPSERLNQVLETIKAEATQPVISENINSQDVTADYVDLSSRLTNLEATEAQLQQIMDEAVKTDDVLAVYSRLTDIRSQIEVIKGQMKYYEESARLSMVSVDLVADEATQPVTIGGWQLKGEPIIRRGGAGCTR